MKKTVDLQNTLRKIVNSRVIGMTLNEYLITCFEKINVNNTRDIGLREFTTFI